MVQNRDIDENARGRAFAQQGEGIFGLSNSLLACLLEISLDHPTYLPLDTLHSHLLLDEFNWANRSHVL